MASPTGPTNVGVAPNVGGLLCYAPCCIGLIFSIVVVVVEKQSRFLRFHAFQGLLFMAAIVVASVVINVLAGVLGTMSTMLALVGTAAGALVGLVALIGSIFLMIKAYNGEEYELPVIGPMAKGWA
jgi:uncharacterized membrane protein